MPDNRDDQPGGDPPVRRSATRRAGLDRLRASQGSGATESSPTDSSTTGGTGSGRATADQAGTADRETGSTVGSGSTALLEPGALRETEDAAADTGLDDTEAGSAAETPRSLDEEPGQRKGKRRRRRRGPEAETPPVAADPGPNRRLKILAAALAVLVIALLVPVVLMRHRIVPTSESKNITRLVSNREEALAAGRRFSVTFLTVDYKTVDNYSNQVLAATTGDFNKDFAGKRGDLKTVLNQAQSQGTGRVLSAGVSKVTGGTVEVIVVADQDVKNKLTKGKTVTNRYRMQLNMQSTPKGWLVSALSEAV